MISNVILYKNLRFIRIFQSGSSPIPDKICSFHICSTQHKRARDHQRACRIIITTAGTARNISLIVETIVTSHTCGLICWT